MTTGSRLVLPQCFALALAGSALVVAPGCRKLLPNDAPVITSVSGPSSVRAGASASFTCNATDPNGDALTYTWSRTAGSLNGTTGKTVTWTAPSTSGSATVSVTVDDGRKGPDASSKLVSVTPITTTLIDWSGTVSAGQWTYWTETLAAGYTISGNFGVAAYDINFFVLDAANYQLWSNSQQAQGIVVYNRSSGASFSASISSTDTYYFVLDNSYSLITPKSATLYVTATSP